jgi:hypothetical protein
VALVFDAATHAYTLDGITIPSCTRVLDHAGLVDYSMIRQEILERKSLLGSLVHQATHFYDEQDLDFSSLTDDIKYRVEAWANFRIDTGFVPRLIEKRFVATVNGMTYGLTIDREGLFKKDEAIVDLKTSATIEDWVAVQTSGYALGVPDYNGKTLSPLALFHRRRRMAVQLLSNGKYFKRDFEDRNDATVFISGLHITHWKLNHKKPLRKIEE